MSAPHALSLRRQAEVLAAPLPPLLVAAEHLAASVQMGAHGRRRAGTGDEFWQFRSAAAGDTARAIDWRRSARSDAQYVREREWQAAQSVHFWVDGAASMQFTGAEARPAKAARARLLALALAVLMVRGGERVGLLAPPLPPRPGRAQLLQLALLLAEAGTRAADYGAPEVTGLAPHARAVLLSDFLGEIGAVEAALALAARRGVSGVLIQVLDPDEEAFPYGGRVVFESMAGSLRHETRAAGDLRARYLARLAERRDLLAALARAAGWQFASHVTGQPAAAALLWAFAALERGH